MNYMTDIEINKYVELGRKYPNINSLSMIKHIQDKNNMDKENQTQKTLKLITKIICDYMNEKIEELLTVKGNGSGRSKLVRIRQIVSLITYDHYRYNEYQIGKYLQRDRTAIISSLKKARNYYDIEKQFKADVDNCRNLIERAIIDNNEKIIEEEIE